MVSNPSPASMPACLARRRAAIVSLALIAGALSLATALLGYCATASAASDQGGTAQEWQARASVAEQWLQGHFADRWSEQVRYDGPPIQLRFSAHNPSAASVVRDVFLPSFDVLRRMSNGKLIVQATWGGAVHSLSEGWEALAEGRTDMTACYASLESETRGFQLLTLLDLPDLFANAAIATMVSEQLYSQYFKSDFARNGVLIARMKATGPSTIFSLERLSTVDGIAELRIASADGVQARAIRALGAHPVVMESPRVRDALRERKLDAAAITEAAAAVYGIDRVAQHGLQADIGRTNLEYCLSPAFYRRLPPDLKPILNAWLRAEAQAETQIFYGLNGARARDAFAASGGTTRELDPAQRRRWDERLNTVQDDAVARLEAMALPARRFMADLRRLTARYAGWSENDLMRESIERPIQGMLD